MPDLWQDLLDCLDISPHTGQGVGDARYQGRNQKLDSIACSVVNCSRSFSGSHR